MSFQGSDTTRVVVRFHAVAGGDYSRDPSFTVDSTSSRTGAPSVVAVTTQQKLGAASGTYTIDLKAERGSAEDALMDLEEEDWAEIVFYRFDGSYFGMRGPIDLIYRKETTSNGATTRTFQIAGRTIGKAFTATSVWFDFFSDGEQGPGLQAQVFAAYEAFNAPPNTTVRTILGGFLDKVRERGRAIWEIPASLKIGAYAAQSTIFHDAGFVNYPVRVNAIHPSMFNPNRPELWSYAQGYSDPEFCELFVDALDAGGAPSPLKGALSGTDSSDAEPIQARPDSGVAEQELGSIRDAVIFRDRPFLSSTWRAAESGPDLPLDQGPMSKLVTVSAPRRMVADMNVSRSGLLRKNTFMCSTAVMNSLTGQQFDLQLPLQDVDSVRRHGFRRMDATTQYYFKPTDNAQTSILAAARVLRNRLRDFHCMNHLFWNGTVSFVNGRPDLRIGNRLRIEDETDARGSITYYVEGVSHTWTLNSGLRTSATVSRGFYGSDNDLLNEFRSQVAGYAVVTPARVGSANTQPLSYEQVTTPGLGCDDDDFTRLGRDYVLARTGLENVMRFKQMFIDAAAAYPLAGSAYNLPALLAAICYIESSGNPYAIGKIKDDPIKDPTCVKRDYGLMQINKKAHYEWVQNWRAGRLPGIPQPYDIRANVFKGAEVLQTSYNYVGSNAVFPITAQPDRTLAALAGYNAGHGAVVKAVKNGFTADSVTHTGHYSANVDTAYNSHFLLRFA